MSECRDVLERLDAFRDGALAPADADAVAAHLEGCTSCAQAARNADALEVRLRGHYRAIAPPPGLWSRIHRDVGAGASGGRGPDAGARRRQFTRWPRWAAQAGLGLAVLVALAFPFLPRPEPAPADELAVVLVNELDTFAISARGLDFESTTPAAVRGWFTSKIDFDPPPPLAEVAHFRLRGGRLCNILDRRVVSYMYQAGPRIASLYIMAEADRPGADSSLGRSVESAGESASGYAHVTWIGGGLYFALVGSPSLEELRALAASFRSALSAAAVPRPASEPTLVRRRFAGDPGRGRA